MPVSCRAAQDLSDRFAGAGVVAPVGLAPAAGDPDELPRAARGLRAPVLANDFHRSARGAHSHDLPSARRRCSLARSHRRSSKADSTTHRVDELAISNGADLPAAVRAGSARFAGYATRSSSRGIPSSGGSSRWSYRVVRPTSSARAICAMVTSPRSRIARAAARLPGRA